MHNQKLNHNHAIIFNQLARLEELQLQPIINNTPNPPNRKRHTKRNPKPPKRPIEVPIETILCGLLDQHPHEARVRKCHRKCQPSQQSGETGEERQCYTYEEVDEPVNHPETWPDPDWARPVCPVGVAGFKVVENRHGVDLKAAQATEDDEEEGGCKKRSWNVVFMEAE